MPRPEYDLMRRMQRLQRDVQRRRTRTPSDSFQWSGARLMGALLMEAHYGGGELRWAWNGQSRQNWGAGYLTEWTAVSLTSADFYTTDNGAMYVLYDGANDYWNIADAAWQEPATYTFLVWCWCYTTSLADARYMVSKWELTGDQRSYRLFYAPNAFGFSVSSDGTAATVVTATSTYAEAVDTWYFAAGYLNPSTLQRIYLAAATDTEVSSDDAVLPPASCYNGTAPTAIGCAFNGGAAITWWSGGISMAALRVNTPATDIDAYVQNLFVETRWAFGGT